MATSEPISRAVLPIPDPLHVGATTYDAKDPAASFPPIVPLRPPKGAPNVLVILLDDAGFGSSSAFGGPCETPGLRTHRRRWPQVHPLPYDRALLADPSGTAQRPQPSLRRDGRHHRDRHVGAGLQLGPPEEQGPDRRGPQAQRLLDRPVRQVPRGPGLGDEPDGPVRRLADGQRVRALLRLHRWRDEPVRPGDLSGHRPRRAGDDAGRGVPLHRGHDRPRHRVGPPAEGPDGRQAVLRLLRAGRDARPPSRPDRMVGQVQGPVRRWLGRPARAHARAAEGPRCHPAGRRTDRPTGGDPRLGRHGGRPQARPRAADGGLCRVHGAHRPPRRAPHRRPCRDGDPRRHAGVRDRRGQRRLGRRDPAGLLQRD